MRKPWHGNAEEELLGSDLGERSIVGRFACRLVVEVAKPGQIRLVRREIEVAVPEKVEQDHA